jgi:hypothetical protein
MVRNKVRYLDRQYLRLTTAEEGQYMKAYLAYLGGWREQSPSYRRITPEKAAMIRSWCEALLGTVAAPQLAEVRLVGKREALQVTCAECGARPGQPCREGGQILDMPHAVRRRFELEPLAGDR